ncbi:MAG: SMI1/KNR4 family protein [Planctomycetaceae bacterium]|nr:SMI1/KNR4 family protein [Planctomycetaceae bacterium]
MDALIARLKERLQFAPAVEGDKHCVRSNDRGEILPPRKPNQTISLADVDSVEQQLGFRLPTILRRLSTEVADGGYGPDWGINRLKHPPNYPFGPFWDVEMSAESWHRLYREADDEESRKWLASYPQNYIRYCECGCNISIGVDCATDAGKLLVDDPNESESPAGGLKPLSESIEEWLWKWLEQPWPTTTYSSLYQGR